MRSTGICCAIGCAVIAAASAGAEAQITPTFDDVPYGVVPLDAGGTQMLLMDIYRPSGTGPFPMVVWIHGGGWSGGSYQTPPPALGQMLARGIAMASVEYRLSGVAIFPAQIHDVKGAVRFLRANATTYNLDPNRFGSWGSSAGGHLSALLATSGGVPDAEGTSGGNLSFSSRVQVCVDWFGPTDILNMNLDVTTPPGSTIDHDSPNSPESHLIGFDGSGEGIGVLRANQGNSNPPFPEKMALVNLANPISHVSADDPTFLMVHGDSDTLVPFRQSIKLLDALTAIEHEAVLMLVPGAGHGGFPLYYTNATVDYFSAHLTGFLVRGDMNCDGRANGRDLRPFLLALTDPAGYQQQWAPCAITRGDFTNDGLVLSDDVGPFVSQVLQSN